jgi:hypothetical protein
MPSACHSAGGRQPHDQRCLRRMNQMHMLARKLIALGTHGLRATHTAPAEQPIPSGPVAGPQKAEIPAPPKPRRWRTLFVIFVAMLYSHHWIPAPAALVAQRFARRRVSEIGAFAGTCKNSDRRGFVRLEQLETQLSPRLAWVSAIEAIPSGHAGFFPITN